MQTIEEKRSVAIFSLLIDRKIPGYGGVEWKMEHQKNLSGVQ